MKMTRKSLAAALVLAGTAALASVTFAQATAPGSQGASGSVTTPSTTPSRSPAATTPPTLPSTTPSTMGSPSTSGMGTPSTTASNTGTSGMTGGTGSMSSTRSLPTKTETADSAFRKLDSTHKGYVSKQDAQNLTGFDFTVADANHDGRLSQDEFKRAWGMYASTK